jgi:hypothetical protein
MEEDMRRIQFILLAAVVALSPTLVVAETSADGSEGSEALVADSVVRDSDVSQEAPSVAPSEGAGDLAWGSFDDPEFDPASGTPQDVSSTPEADAISTPAVEDMVDETERAADAAKGDGIQLTGSQAFELSNGVRLGPIGIDDLGRRGRLHTVVSGDTLWDLAAAYLGTPWVWPSVWIDNDDIENPHLIIPGDKIWITANEMRVVTDAQAESFLESVVEEAPVATDGELAFAEDAAMDYPAELSPVAAFEGEAEIEIDDPSTLEAFPVAVAGQESETMASGLQITISQRDAMGFVSADDLAGASSIVDSPVERTYLAEGDFVVLGMGEGDLEIGDQFTIFQTVEIVRDVETNRILGHHVDILGWAEVRELTGDTSLAEIRTSYSEISRGVRVMRRAKLDRRVTARATPDAIEGKIVFLPGERTVMADGDYAYLNRGEFHGVEIGSELEVFVPGTIINDRSRRVDVRTPDHSVARLVVVSVTAETSVAFILTSNRELEVGDHVRPQLQTFAQR